MRLVPFLGLLAMAACGGNPAQPTPVDLRVVLAPGQTTTVRAASLSVRFDTVLSDSRCPATALCIWAGDAVVRIDVVPDRGTRQSYELHVVEPRATVHDGLTISLVELSPFPFDFRPIPTGDYRATLRISR